MEIPARVEQARLLRRRGRGEWGSWGHPHKVEERGGEEGEGEVEEEAAIGLEAEDTGGDAEERGREGLEVDEGP